MRWTWVKGHEEEDENHPCWRGTRADGLTAAIWLSGGDAGEYLTMGAGRHKTLAAAKVATVRHYEN